MRASDLPVPAWAKVPTRVVPHTLTRVLVNSRPPQARQLLLLLVMLLLPVALLAVCSTAWAQSTNTREQEQIRRLRQQLQQLQQEQGANAQSAQRAQAEAAENKRQLDALKADLNRSRSVADGAKKQATDLAAKQAQDAALATQTAQETAALRTERDALQAKATEQDTLLARNALELNTLRQEVAQRQNSLSLRANALADLNQRHQRQAQGLQSCMSNNEALHQLGKELLDRYANKTTADILLQTEPVLQFKRVALENLVRGYQDKLDQQALKPAAGGREP
jgi:chromosome segregation ATPase